VTALVDGRLGDHSEKTGLFHQPTGETSSTHERVPASQGKCKRVSDVVLEDKVLVSRRLEDKNQSLGYSLGLETKSLRTLKTFASMTS